MKYIRDADPSSEDTRWQRHTVDGRPYEVERFSREFDRRLTRKPFDELLADTLDEHDGDTLGEDELLPDCRAS